MVGVQGIGSIPEPANPRRAQGRASGFDAAGAEARDEVRISPVAQEAASVARLIEEAERQAEVRAEHVAEVKASLERGTYKLQEVVLQVAARVSRYVRELGRQGV